MIRPDTLRRLINNDSNNLNIKSNLINLKNEEIIKKIIKLYENTEQRKNLINEINKLEIIISKAKLNNILSNCDRCKPFDKSRYKPRKLIKNSCPGEIVACDIVEINKGVIFINLIDYFSKKVWSQTLKNKLPINIINFLEKILSQFKTFLGDNGKEFSNKSVADWCHKKILNINLVFLIIIRVMDG
ncbi:hypothetical protein DMUE_2515 [Dictyocoela muelleri]|nr:hypothetical protein DMUE_2515 [Dictyocoela muelleri]